MLPLIRFINSFLYQEQSTNSSIENNVTSIVKDPEEARLLGILEAPDDATDSSGDDDDDNNADLGGEGPQCFQSLGIVTAVGVLDGIIDGTHRFQLKDAPDNIKEGQTVEYLAFQPSADDDIIIRKIITITDELWTEEVAEPVAKTTDDTKKKKAIFERHKVCRLSKRNGREVFIDPPGDYSFNLDHVKISFVPIPGDWLTVVMRVEESEDSLNGVGEILEILEVMPLRFKSTEGVVSHWKADQKMGIIDRETYFTLDACEIGYVPVVGDQIDAHIIESHQGHLSWRALKVIPATERTSYNRKNDTNFRKSMLAQSADAHGELLQNKYGISISTRCNFGKLRYGNERDMIVEVKNSSKIVHQLASVGFCNKFQTQMKLVEPVFKSDQYYQIDIGETVKFVFRCQAKFFGNAEELFVWNFKAFNIGRFLRVEVEDEYLQEVKNNKYQRKPKIEIDRENIVPTKNGFIINGIRSSRKAAFIPIKLGVFKVPDQFWSIMADNRCGFAELQLRLLSSIGCLQEELTVANYRNRWHALLYVEEVHAVLQMRNYDMSRALFRRCGEYLVLDVPGVMEKRPSLIVGDAVYASHPDGAATDELGIKYEGFIHKIVRNDLFIKFNPTFHHTYDDKDYNVSFVSNRSAFRKCHQAIHVAFKNLGSDWLFPSSLRPSAPLFILEEADNDKQEEENGNCGGESESVERSTSSDNIENERKIEENGGEKKDPPKLSNGVEKLFKKESKVLVNNELESRQSQSATQNDSPPNLKDIIFKMPLKNPTNNNVGANNINESGLSSPPNRLPVADWLLKSKKVGKRRSLMDFLNSGEANNAGMNGNQPAPLPAKIPTLEEVEKQMLMNTPPKNMVTLSEIEKPLLNKSNSNTNVTLSEIEKPLLNKSNSNTKVTLSEIEKPFLNKCNSNTNTKVTLSEIEKPLLSKSNSNSNTKVTLSEIEKPLLNKSNNRFTITENSKEVDWNEDCYQARKAVVKDVKVEECQVKTTVQWFNRRLNYHQKEAVRRILRNEARPLPYIIFGPPGTGKTVTLVETALQILFLRPESRLLIASPSNSAADCISEKLIDTGIFPVGTLARLCSLTYLTNERCSVKLAPYCTAAEYRVISGDQTFVSEDGMRKSTRQALGRHRVTVGTCVTLGSMYNMGFPQGHFTHVLVDEAGQATEPEVLIPLCLLDNKTGQSVLVGDPQQLGPVIFSQHSKNLGLGQSLIARLLDTFPYCRDMQSFPATHGFDPRLVTQLVDNYRSLPEILKLPSQMFYEDRLVPHVAEDGFEASILKRLKVELPPRNTDLPPALIFHGVRGSNYQEEDSPSWFNPQEVVQTVAYVVRLFNYGLTGDDIGIITPYNKQAYKIRQLLSKLDVTLPKVGSVEEFQGQERLVILLSTVRTTHRLDSNMKQLMGFISSPQRLNVGLTRARALLVIMGDPHLLNHDPYWRTVLDYCIRNDAYCGCEAPVKGEQQDGLPDFSIE